MAEIISMRKGLEGNWGLDLVLKKRKALLRSVPMSPEIIEIEKWLVKQPLPTRELIKIWSRMVRALLFEYGNASPDRKREILLFLREQRKAMPPRVREDLWEVWFQWLDELEEEEIAAGERAASDRCYVWTPEARDEMRAEIKKEKASNA
jgi:hypothetical protein